MSFDPTIMLEKGDLSVEQEDNLRAAKLLEWAIGDVVPGKGLMRFNVIGEVGSLLFHVSPTGHPGYGPTKSADKAGVAWNGRNPGYTYEMGTGSECFWEQGDRGSLWIGGLSVLTGALKGDIAPDGSKAVASASGPSRRL